MLFFFFAFRLNVWNYALPTISVQVSESYTWEYIQNPIFVHIPKFTFRSRKIYTSWAESKYFSIHKSRFSFDSYVSDVLKFSYSTKTKITFYISGVKEMSEDEMKTKSKYWIIHSL